MNSRWICASGCSAHSGSPWQESGYVFTSPDGGPLDRKVPLRLLRRLLRGAGLAAELHLHGLHRSAPSLLLAQGLDSVVLTQILGDARLNMATHYLRLLAPVIHSTAERMERALGDDARERENRESDGGGTPEGSSTGGRAASFPSGW